MGNINIGDVQIGMKLASDVKNMNGQMLMPKGMMINEKHLTLLKAWGITEVEIEGISREEVAIQAAAQIDPQILTRSEAHITHLFRHVDRKHPAMQELFAQCVLRRVCFEVQKGSL